jgi:glycosyltransferase involved in cell wall biosynthesis
MEPRNRASDLTYSRTHECLNRARTISPLKADMNAQRLCESEPVRLGLVSPLAPAIGGMATQADRLILALRHEGIEVDAIPVRETLALLERVPVIRTVLQYRKRIERLKQIADRVDGIIVCSCTGLYFDLVTLPVINFCRRRGIPVAISQRGSDTETWLASTRRGRRLFRAAAAKATAVHVSSPYMQRTLARYGIDSRCAPILLDLSTFRYRPRTSSAGVIVNNRTLARFHGGPLLLEAFSRVVERRPGVSLIVAGDGVQGPACHALARSLGISRYITFTGALTASGVSDVLATADLVLNTSSEDNIPNAILEAFACGVPVVTSAVGGIPDLVGDDERGYLVRDRNPESFAAAVDRCISDPTGTLRRVEAARLWVEGLCWASLRNQYLDALVKPLLSAADRRLR